jgi:nucleoside-diphosphate-sugar epimerase
MAETVLVTGGTGFIGGWCIVELLKRGYVVRTTVRNETKQASVRAAVAAGGAPADRLNFAIADLTADAGWNAAVADCDYVLHVASPLGDGRTTDRDAFIAAARDGTLRVLRAATMAGVKRVVMTSAAAAARVPKGIERISDETVWADAADPRFDAYRRSKILAERAAWDFMAGKHTALTTVLPGAVFGPILNKDAMSSVRIIAGLLRGQPPRLAKLGFWIVDVRDLADLHIRAMTAPVAKGERFLATGDFLWLTEIAQVLRTRLGKQAAKVPTRTLPNFAVRLAALFIPSLRSLAPELGRRNAVTSEKARQMLGFAPRPAAATIIDCAESVLAR